MWDINRLREVSLSADASGLRIAMHAIGDHASDVALDVLDSVRIGVAGACRERGASIAAQ